MATRRVAQIIVPTAVPQRVYEQVLKDAALLFGGWTSHHGEGGWIDHSGELVREPVHVVTIAVSYEPHERTYHDAMLRDLARRLVTEGGQTSAYVQLPSGDVHFYEASDLCG